MEMPLTPTFDVPRSGRVELRAMLAIKEALRIRGPFMAFLAESLTAELAGFPMLRFIMINRSIRDMLVRPVMVAHPATIGLRIEIVRRDEKLLAAIDADMPMMRRVGLPVRLGIGMGRHRAGIIDRIMMLLIGFRL